MINRITVPLLLNITGETIPLFEPYQAYKLSPQRVKVFKNVFVAHSGFCLNSKGLIKECHHNHPPSAKWRAGFALFFVIVAINYGLSLSEDKVSDSILQTTHSG